MRICFKLIWYCNFLLCLPVPAVCRSHCLYGSTSVFYYYNDASFKAILLFSMSSYFNRSIIFLLFIQYNLSQQLVLCGSGVLLVWHNSGSFVSLLLCLFSVCALVIYRCCAYMSASACLSLKGWYLFALCGTHDLPGVPEPTNVWRDGHTRVSWRVWYVMTILFFQHDMLSCKIAVGVLIIVDTFFLFFFLRMEELFFKDVIRYDAVHKVSDDCIAVYMKAL